jgi:hypothetical protein
MTFIEAAAEVLRQAGKPLHYKEITELAITKNLLSHVGKTPEVTMSHRLTAAMKKDDKDVPIVKVKPGVFALREWQGRKRDATSPSEASEATAIDGAAGDEGGMEVNALEIEAALRTASDADDGDDDDETSPQEAETAISGDDALRADLAASGADFFDDEDDDDQPILAPPAQPGVAGAPGAAVGAAEGGRRRRRRRRRGRGGQADGAPGHVSGAQNERASTPRVDAAISSTSMVPAESDSAMDSREAGASPRPVVRDRQQIMAGGQPTGIDVPLGEGDELAGRDLADAASIVLSSFDRNAGPAPVRAIVDALMRRGRLQGEPTIAAAQVGACLRADNLRRSSNGQRPRFRFASGGRVGLTDWALGGELPRLEQDVIVAVERYREASRRAMLRRLQELPGHALIELALVALERAGMTGIKAVRRSGSPGGESHFTAAHKTAGDTIVTAIVIRKDGREIGRERVTDLRGALHHYGPATTGWLITTGQVLSGAREEAAAAGAPPVTLYDGVALCRLLEDVDVGVVKTRFAIAITDSELLEAIRG